MKKIKLLIIVEESNLSESNLQNSYYFLHIPKTGGTSLTSVLDRFFEAELIYPQQLWWHVGDIEYVKQQSFQFIRGHFGLGAQLLSSNQLKIWTMFRNPVQLAHSTYQYIIREKKTIKHHEIVSKQISFEGFLTDPKLAHLATNRLVKAMSFGLNSSAECNMSYITKENYKQFLREMNRKRKASDKTELLSTIKSELNKLHWFGLQEDFDFSIAMLCFQMNWPPIGTSPRLNALSEVIDISEKNVEKIKQLNDLDMELYEYIKELYEQRKRDFLCSIGLPPDAGLSLVEQMVDQNYKKNYLECNNLTLKESFEYDFSDVLLGQNWHQREWHETAQFYFRWTGPEAETSIDFWINPADLQMTVEVINAIDFSALNSLVIKVNDKETKYQIVKYRGSHQIIINVKKMYIQANGLLRLTIANIATKTHQQQFNSCDTRIVGLAVKKIDIIINPNQY